MARLPTPCGDNNKWGVILNYYLSVAHNPDGTLKVEVTDASKLQGTPVSSIAPTESQVLTYNNSTGEWEAHTYIRASTKASGVPMKVNMLKR
jgi:hypothetical protein